MKGLKVMAANTPTNVVGEKVCTRCSKGKQYDSNGLCIKCNFNKMMGGEVV